MYWGCAPLHFSMILITYKKKVFNFQYSCHLLQILILELESFLYYGFLLDSLSEALNLLLHIRLDCLCSKVEQACWWWVQVPLGACNLPIQKKNIYGFRLLQHIIRTVSIKSYGNITNWKSSCWPLHFFFRARSQELDLPVRSLYLIQGLNMLATILSSLTRND
jgi:hypothetical protein